MKIKKSLSLLTSLLLSFSCMTCLPSDAVSIQTPELSDSFQTASERMQLRISDEYDSNVISAVAGSDVTIVITAKSAYGIKSLENFSVNFPQYFAVTGMSATSPLFNGSVSYTANGNTVNFTISGNGSLGTGNVATITCHVDSNCPEGSYTISWTSGTCTDASGHSQSLTLPPKQIKVSSSGNVQTSPKPSTTATTTTATAPSYYNPGDVNCDYNVSISDAVLLLQWIANPDSYYISEQGKSNADVYNCGDGITASDALSIQKLEAKLIWNLPESYK